MAITALDPRTALVVVDLQKGLLSLPTVHPTADSVSAAAAPAAGCRRHDLPVVLVNAAGIPLAGRNVP